MFRRCEKDFWDGTYRRSTRISCTRTGEGSWHLGNIGTSDLRSSIRCCWQCPAWAIVASYGYLARKFPSFPATEIAAKRGRGALPRETAEYSAHPVDRSSPFSFLEKPYRLCSVSTTASHNFYNTMSRTSIEQKMLELEHLVCVFADRNRWGRLRTCS